MADSILAGHGAEHEVDVDILLGPCAEGIPFERIDLSDEVAELSFRLIQFFLLSLQVICEGGILRRVESDILDAHQSLVRIGEIGRLAAAPSAFPHEAFGRGEMAGFEMVIKPLVVISLKHLVDTIIEGLRITLDLDHDTAIA